MESSLFSPYWKSVSLFSSKTIMFSSGMIACYACCLILGWKCEVNISELFHSKHTAEPENLRLTVVELDKNSQLVIQKNNSTIK